MSKTLPLLLSEAPHVPHEAGGFTEAPVGKFRVEVTGRDGYTEVVDAFVDAAVVEQIKKLINKSDTTSAFKKAAIQAIQYVTNELAKKGLNVVPERDAVRWLSRRNRKVRRNVDVIAPDLTFPSIGARLQELTFEAVSEAAGPALKALGAYRKQIPNQSLWFFPVSKAA